MAEDYNQRNPKGHFLPGNSIGFQSGQSGNPNGARGSITNALKKELLSQRRSKKTVAEQIAKKLVLMALKGDLGAIREILDRIEGKPRQAIDMELQIDDWRELARREGLSEADVIREARILIESAHDSSSSQSNPGETQSGDDES